LYVSDVAASVPVPIRQLQGFERVHLAPGETKTVAFTLTPRQLSLIDDEGRRVIEPGGFQIAVGGHQPGAEDFVDTGTSILIETFEVIGETPSFPHFKISFSNLQPLYVRVFKLSTAIYGQVAGHPGGRVLVPINKLPGVGQSDLATPICGGQFRKLDQK
jgi:hypothetical protein